MDSRAEFAIVAAFLTCIVGVFPYLFRRSKLTLMFAASNLALALWNIADVAVLLPIEPVSKLVLVRIFYIPGICMVLCFYRFMVCFAEYENDVVRNSWRIFVVAGTFFIGISPTAFLVRGLDETSKPFRELPGPLYPLFIMYLLCGLGLPLYWFFVSYFSSEGELHRRLKYMIAALIFGFFAAILFFTTLYVPNIPPYYFLLQILYGSIVAYAIVVQRVMDVTIIIRRTLIYSLMSAAIAAIYLAIGATAATFFQNWSGYRSVFSSAAAFCLISVIFDPLRRRIQHFVDRHFFREALDQELLREATSGFVHEIKGPLANISLPAELGLMDLQQIKQGLKQPVDILPKIEQRLQYILQVTSDAARKIEAIREFSFANDAPRSSLSLIAVLKKSVSDEETFSRRYNVDITVQADPLVPFVLGNAKQLEIVFNNLIRNAVQAMSKQRADADKTLTIAVEVIAETFVIEISDTGPGISPADLPNIFEPYFSTKGSDGMGIGLYLCRQIIQAHGGSIDANSTVGKGAVFVVRLPVFKRTTAI